MHFMKTFSFVANMFIGGVLALSLLCVFLVEAHAEVEGETETATVGEHTYVFKKGTFKRYTKDESWRSQGKGVLAKDATVTIQNNDFLFKAGTDIGFWQDSGFPNYLKLDSTKQVTYLGQRYTLKDYIRFGHMGYPKDTTLASNQIVKIDGSPYLLKGGKLIAFHNNGMLAQGQLHQEADIIIGRKTYKGKLTIKFYENGRLESVVLVKTNVTIGEKDYPMSHQISLREDGTVEWGYLSEEISLKLQGITYRLDVAISFYEDSSIRSAGFSKADQDVTFKGRKYRIPKTGDWDHYSVHFHKSGYPKTLKAMEAFTIGNLSYKKGDTVSFDEDGNIFSSTSKE